MKRAALLLALLACVACQPSRPVCPDADLLRQLTESSFLHTPLPLDLAHSAEAEGLAKRVLAEEVLPLQADDWSFSGPGSLRVADTAVVLTHPSLTGRRATGPADDPDYATYGTATARCDLHGRDLSAYNRIVLEVRPDCDGGRVCGLNLSFNGHEAHLMNFANRTWNEVFLDLDEISRESVSGFTLHTTLKGKDLVTGDCACFAIRNIRFQRVENPERQSGWQPMPDRIIYSMSGYFSGGAKTALVSGDALESEKTFRLVDERGRAVRKGKVAPVSTSLKRV